MNYLDTLKQQYPEIGKYSDDEILSVLPELNPALASMSPEQIHAFATTDAPSSLWDIAKSGYQSVMGNREIAGAVSDIKDLNDPEFADVTAAQPRGNSMMGVSADELRRRSKAAAGQEDVLMSEAQSRLDSGNERLRKAGEVTLSPTTERFLTGGDSGRSWWEDFAADPITIISEIGAQSAYGSAEALGTGLLGSAAGPVGFAVGGGLGSGRIEFANTVVDELKKAGVDVTDAGAVREALSENPDLYQHATSQGLKRATAIGALDAATMGLASKSLGIGSGLTRQATNLLAQGVVQSGGGAAGEALAQVATEGEIKDTRAVAAEAVGELVTAPVDVLAATRDPMGAAQRRIDRAGEEAAAKGGDALDQEIAKAKTAVDEIPKAAAAQDVQTAADLGVEFPQSEPLTDVPVERQSRADRMSGIDGMILAAERMGFTDEEVLLRRAKRLYQQAEQARASGNDKMASLYVDGGNRLYRSATEAQEPLRAESANFPVPYTFDGQVSGGDLVPSSAPNFTMPPEDIAGRATEIPTPQTALPGSTTAQLPPGTGQINMGRDRPQRTFTPAQPVTEGIGRNVVERQAQMAPGLPQGNAARTITPNRFRELQALRREGLRTKLRERTPEQIEAIQTVAAVQAGEVEVAEAAPNIEPTAPNTPEAAPDIAGEPIDNEWTAFAPESGTLNVPRADMPQVKAEHRGALVNYLNARGIEHEQAEIDPRTLKATQREFSPAKVQKAREYEGGERSILVSSDGHVVDGHHQWLAKRENGEPMKVIQLQAPIRDLVPLLHDFPSSEVDGGATQAAPVDANETSVGETQTDLSVAGETQETDKAAVLEAYRQLGREYPDRQMVVAGELAGGFSSRLQQQVGRRLSADEVRSLAPMEERQAAYQEGQAEAQSNDRQMTEAPRAAAPAETAAAEPAADQATTEQPESAESVGDTAFSRADDTGPAIAFEDAQRLARDIVSGWKNAPDTVVVRDESALPADLRQYIEQDGASGQIDGVFHKGKVYLIADNIKSEADVQRILFHEALGHYGMRQLYGGTLELHLDQLWKRIGGLNGVRQLEKRYGFKLGPYWDNAASWEPGQRRRMMVDELIAHIAGTGQVEPSLMQRIAHLIRQGLRKLFGDTRFGTALEQMTDVELLRIVAAARDAVTEGEAGVTYATHDPVFVRMFYRAMYDRTDANESSDTRYSRTTTAEQFDDLNEDQTSFLNKIGPKTATQKLRDRIAGVMDNIGLKTRQGMVDRYASLLELDKKAQGDDVVENRTRFSSWVLSKMSHSADGALSAMLTHGRIQFSDGVIELREGDQKGLMDVLKELGSTEEIERFLGWIAANRSQSIMEKAQAARDRAEAAKAEKANLQDMLKEPEIPPGKAKAINKAIRDADAVIKRELDAAAVDERLFTPEEVEAGVKLNQGKTKNGKPRGLVYAKVFREFQQYRDDVLAIAEQSGIITADNRAMWREEFYVPFYRVMEEEGTKGPQISKGLSRQEAYKRLKGGSQEINDLLENTLMNFQHLLSASLKNNAARQALTNAEAIGIATRTTESGRNKKASTYVLDNGEKVWYDIEDDLVYESLTALADMGSNTMSRRIMRSFKRTFTSFTTISPQFVVANTLRDALQSIAIGNLSYNAFSNVVKGAKAYGGPNNKGRTRGDMLASGASFSFGHIYGAGDIDALKSGIQRQIKGAKTIKSPKDVAGLWRAAWDQYTGYGDTMENANRAAIYEQNLSKGKDKLYAAFQSRDLMDFSSQGAWAAVKFLTDVVPFLNARLVGLDRLYRGGIQPSLNVIKHMLGGPEASMTDRQAAQRFGIVVGSLTAATIALYLANMDDDRFKELEEWERDAYWHIWVGDNHFTIPKPFEIGAIATVAERTLEQAIDDTKDGKLFAERMGHILTDTFAFNPIPQAAKPLFDLYANKDSFTGRDIESLSMLRLSPINRERASTTDPARAASWLMDKTLGKLSQDLVWSPVQIDFLIQGYLGWVGSMGASTVDVISKSAQGVETPHKKWHEYQPIRRFFRDDSNPKSFTRYGTEFYNHLREVDMLYADIQNLRKLGEMTEAAELLRENRNKLRYRQLLNRAQRRLSTINSQIKLTQMNRSLSAEAKRQRIDVLTAQRNLLTKRVVERLEEG